MNKPVVVIFDLGNVLVHIHPECFLQSLGIDSPENRRYFQPFVIEAVQRYERGEETTGQYLERISQLVNIQAREHQPSLSLPKHLFTREQLVQAMKSIIGDPIQEMEQLVHSVAKNYQTALLSNTNPLHYDHCLEHLPVLHQIPQHILSYKFHCLKPGSLIFEKAAQYLHADPSEILFIDDAAENVRGAAEIGYRFIQFQGKDALESKLRILEIL
ncbi:MAG: HAD family phosphatase [bacterium]